MKTSTVVERAERQEVDIIRAWIDEAYYDSLSETEKAEVPPNPAGAFMPEIELRSVTKTPVACYPCSFPTCQLSQHTHH